MFLSTDNMGKIRQADSHAFRSGSYFSFMEAIWSTANLQQNTSVLLLHMTHQALSFEADNTVAYFNTRSNLHQHKQIYDGANHRRDTESDKVRQPLDKPTLLINLSKMLIHRFFFVKESRGGWGEAGVTVITFQPVSPWQAVRGSSSKRERDVECFGVFLWLYSERSWRCWTMLRPRLSAHQNMQSALFRGTVLTGGEKRLSSTCDT